jgi:hypothetical protein
VPLPYDNPMTEGRHGVTPSDRPPAAIFTGQRRRRSHRSVQVARVAGVHLRQGERSHRWPMAAVAF